MITGTSLFPAKRQRVRPWAISKQLTDSRIDNAIPIQGWINDPTDNDLQHLIPFFEGLQYVSDVRALLALRGGEDGQHMVA